MGWGDGVNQGEPGGDDNVPRLAARFTDLAGQSYEDTLEAMLDLGIELDFVTFTEFYAALNHVEEGP